MAVDVVTQIRIQRPLNEVATYTENPDNAPIWYDNIRSVEWRTEPPVRLGTRVAFVARFLGKRLAYTYEVVEYRPGECLVMKTSEGPFPMETSYHFTAIGETETEVRLQNRGEPTGFSKLMSPFTAGAMKRVNEKDLRKLKGLLEQ